MHKCEENMKKIVRKKTQKFLEEACKRLLWQKSTRKCVNSTKSPKIASSPGILVRPNTCNPAIADLYIVSLPLLLLLSHQGKGGRGQHCRSTHFVFFFVKTPFFTAEYCQYYYSDEVCWLFLSMFLSVYAFCLLLSNVFSHF